MTIKERKQLIDVIANYTNHTVKYLKKIIGQGVRSYL